MPASAGAASGAGADTGSGIGSGSGSGTGSGVGSGTVSYTHLNLTGIDYTLLCVLFAVFALAFVMLLYLLMKDEFRISPVSYTHLSRYSTTFLHGSRPYRRSLRRRQSPVSYTHLVSARKLR